MTPRVEVSAYAAEKIAADQDLNRRRLRGGVTTITGIFSVDVTEV